MRCGPADTGTGQFGGGERSPHANSLDGHQGSTCSTRGSPTVQTWLSWLKHSVTFIICLFVLFSSFDPYSYLNDLCTNVNMFIYTSIIFLCISCGLLIFGFNHFSCIIVQ